MDDFKSGLKLFHLASVRILDVLVAKNYSYLVTTSTWTQPSPSSAKRGFLCRTRTLRDCHHFSGSTSTCWGVTRLRCPKR
jgi:hypothetical protein